MNIDFERERLREIFEKEMLGSSTRELFFQLNNELETRVSEIKDKFLNTQINESDDLFIETLLVKDEDIFKFYHCFNYISRIC